MSLKLRLERAERIHRLICLRSTGPPAEFARRLGMSRAGLFKCLRELREMGAPIAYCSSRRTYEYLRPVRFRAGYEWPADRRRA